jgi:hypothetical protein
MPGEWGARFRFSILPARFADWQLEKYSKSLRSIQAPSTTLASYVNQPARNFWPWLKGDTVIHTMSSVVRTKTLRVYL